MHGYNQGVIRGEPEGKSDSHSPQDRDADGFYSSASSTMTWDGAFFKIVLRVFGGSSKRLDWIFMGKTVHCLEALLIPMEKDLMHVTEDLYEKSSFLGKTYDGLIDRNKAEMQQHK